MGEAKILEQVDKFRKAHCFILMLPLKPGKDHTFVVTHTPYLVSNISKISDDTSYHIMVSIYTEFIAEPYIDI